MFDSTKNSLQDLLGTIKSGKMQLPDFQRGWVWDDNRIKGLLASLAVGFPIGAVMLLETGGNEVNFKPRPVTGAKGVNGQKPETLILDGQQRFTSMFQAIMCEEPVSTKDARGKKIRRHYYIDMQAVVVDGNDVEDAIISVPEDKLVRTFRKEISLDVTTAEKEYQQCMFPANGLFSASTWRRAYNNYWNHDPEKSDLFDAFDERVIDSFKTYQIPVIKLSKQTPKEAVCLVFEKVNTGGVSLTVFELLTASFAAEGFQLRDDWRAREKRLKNKYAVLGGVQSDDFLQAISLFVTREVRQTFERENRKPEDNSRAPAISCKRKALLKLTSTQYMAWADRVENGFVRAAKFLHSQKIFKARDVPYRTQIVPLAAILEELGYVGEASSARELMARWYWSGVIGELYGGAIETRFSKDFPEVVEWVRTEDSAPSTVDEASFSANRLKTLRTRNSAAYKGLYALLMRDGCLDLRTGDSVEATAFFDEPLDIHHIFPKAWCEQQNIHRDWYDSVVNKTALTARTNRVIGGKAPSAYLSRLEQEDVTDTRLNEYLLSHRIEPGEIRNDDFWAFYAARAESLLVMIEDVMGTKIRRDEGIFGPNSVSEDEFVDQEEEWHIEY